jgi:hypothetical protein
MPAIVPDSLHPTAQSLGTMLKLLSDLVYLNGAKHRVIRTELLRPVD